MKRIVFVRDGETMMRTVPDARVSWHRRQIADTGGRVLRVERV